MTEERSHPDTDGVSDPLVSRTYRESAQERVPDALDRAVLQQARQNAGNRYSRSVIWLRPMAWAATIGLSLAIVIELANLPQPDPALLALPEAEAPLDLNDAIAPPRFEVEALEPRARKTVDDEGRVNQLNAPTFGKTEAPESAPKPEPASAPVSAPVSDADTFRRQDAAVLEEAEAIARMREGKSTELDAGSVGYFSGPAAAARVPMPCVAEVRLTPETWLKCIVELEDAGLDELASRQREQLQEVFPDFELP